MNIENVELLEAFASLAHDQWCFWSKAVAPEVAPERRARWEKLWVPYTELSEVDKDEDRKWARKYLAELNKQ